MKILFWAVIIVGLAGLGLILWPSPAEPHAGERIALYNLSSTVHRMERSVDDQLEDIARQLDRIETKLTSCD